MASPSDAARQRRRRQRELQERVRRIRAGQPVEDLGARKPYQRALERQQPRRLGGEGPTVGPATKQAVRTHAYRLFAQMLSSTRLRNVIESITFNVNRMTYEQRELSLTFTLTQWRVAASVQSPGNVWWYHAMSESYRREWRGVQWDG
jgi:hypothetical protein